ncbi:MAG: MarR family winged helix-turn-helix transcriptional regulator [Candidatus Bathyarchaeota archaeon]|nr:MarR family winged helix-turn-helix transcriptional regulator [Candidatus Termiticorpusculum sp.]
MDYRQLAKEHLENMQLPGKSRWQQDFIGVPSNGFILFYIELRQEVLPKDISNAMGVSTARVAIALNELAEKELITREIDDDDRRRIIVKLTPKGRKVSAEQKQKFIDGMAEFLTKLGEHDAKEYVRIMGRIVEMVRKDKS